MVGAPATSWRPFAVPCGRRISAGFDSDVRGEGNFYVPSMQVDVEDGAYVVHARIPGAERDELHVCLEAGVLRVTGERRRRRQQRDGGRHEDMRYLSRFTREIGLSREVDADGVEARFENGVLIVRLPLIEVRRAEEGQARLIQVQ